MSLLKIEEPITEKEQVTDEMPIVGIDFGTTNSLVGIVVNDEVRFFKGEDGSELHESVVVFDANGDSSSRISKRNSKTQNDKRESIQIKSIKRLLGKGFSDVADKLGQFDFEIVKDGEDGLKIKIGEKLWSAEEISGMILGGLRELSMDTLGQSSPGATHHPLQRGNLTEPAEKDTLPKDGNVTEPAEKDVLRKDGNLTEGVEGATNPNLEIPAWVPAEGGAADHSAVEKNLKAVITVPAYFDEKAKNAVKLSAKLAGIEVVRLVNEPTAAALAYGLENKKEGIYAVYDLGGGTFDVSILKMQKGVFRVLGVSGDNELGGDDVDQALAEALVEKYPALKDVKKTELIEAAKSLKEGFVSDKSQELTINDVKIAITYDEFVQIITSLIDKTIDITRDLIEELGLEIGDERNEIKGVILVGGSSRIGLIKEKLAKVFGAANIFDDHDPDCVVAQGAVLQAYNLSGGGDALLLDVLPLSLGVEMMGGIVDKIISRNTTIPIAMAKEFTTYADNQTGLKLHIVQGEREFAKDCRSLAHFEVKGISAMRAGLARVLVTFTVDADGLLTVTAKEEVTGEIQEIQVKPTYGLDDGQIKEMLIDSMRNSKEDMTARLLAEVVREARQNIDFMRRDLAGYPDMVTEDEKNAIEEKLVELEKLAENSQDKDEIAAKQKELEIAAEEFILKKVSKTLEVYVDKKVDDV